MPKGCVPAYTNKMCEVAIAEAKEHRQTLQSMFVGAPRHLVSVDGENSVDLAINVLLTKSGSGSCLIRTMIECFPTQMST